MDIEGLAMKKRPSVKAAVLAVAFLLGAAAQAIPAYSQDESITVSCYKGDTEEGNFIGNISVNDPHNAGNDCNNEYEACQGQCLGCVIDSDFNQVCYDNTGMKSMQ